MPILYQISYQHKIILVSSMFSIEIQAFRPKNEAGAVTVWVVTLSANYLSVIAAAALRLDYE